MRINPPDDEDNLEAPRLHRSGLSLTLRRARHRLRQRLGLLSSRVQLSTSHTRRRIKGAGYRRLAINPSRASQVPPLTTPHPANFVASEFLDQPDFDDKQLPARRENDEKADAGYYRPHLTAQPNPAIADPDFEEAYVIQPPGLHPATPAFYVPNDLAAMGMAVRLKAVRTRRPVAIPPAPPGAASTAAFDLAEPAGPYISMFEGAGSWHGDDQDNSPLTVGDQVRRLRPYGAKGYNGPVAYFSTGAAEAEPDQDELTGSLSTQQSGPSEMVQEAVFDPNRRRGRSRQQTARPGRDIRRLLQFRHPGVALVAGLISAIMLVLLIFGLVYLFGFLDKAPVDKFAVIYAQFGEGRGYSSMDSGAAWAKSLGANLIERGGLATAPEVRYNGLIRDAAEALKTGQRTGADATVWGYYERANGGKLYTQLTLSPNGPFDQPGGWGHRFIERQLFDPEQLVFVTAPPPAAGDTRLPLNQLLHALSAYYSGEYDSAVAELSQLLSRGEPENEPGLRLLRGNALLVFGKYAEAVEDYNQIININETALAKSLALPINPAFVHNNRAVALTYLQKYAEANKAFGAALGVRSDLPKIFSNYASLLLSVPDGDFEFQPALLQDWQVRLTKALKLDPRLAPAHLYLGRINRNLGLYEAALAAQNRVRELDINYLESYYELGMTYLDQGLQAGQVASLSSALDAFRWGEGRANSLATAFRERRHTLTDAGNSTLAAVYDSRARETQAEADRMRFGQARVFLELTRLSGKDPGNPLDRMSRWIKGEKTPYEEAGPRLKETAEKRPDDPQANFYYGQFLALTGDGDPLPYYLKAKELEQNPARRFQFHQLLAEQYAAAGQTGPALAEYDQFIKLEPRRLQGYLALSDLQYRLGLYKEAVQTAEAASKLAPTDPRPLLKAAAAHIKNVQLDAALDFLNRALALNPDLAEAHLQRGIALFHLNRRQEALAAFMRASALNPLYATAHYYAGIVYLESLQDAKAAQAEWEKAVAVDPRYAEAWVKLGQLYSQINQLEAAVKAYEQALAINDKDATAHYYVGLLYEGRNTPEGFATAERQYRRAIELAPGLVNAYYRLAKVLQHQGGKSDDVLALAENTVRLDPKNPEAQAALGDVQRARSDYGPTLVAYNAALKLRPDYPEALYGRAAVLFNQQQYDSALADLARALQLRPDWAEAFLLQSQVQTAQGQPTPAFESLAQARRLDPNNPQVLAEFGHLQELRGEIDPAIASLEGSLALYEANAEAQFRLGRLYFSKAVYDRAVKRFKRTQELNSQYPKVYYWLGRGYALLKQYDEARTALDKAVQLEPDFIEGHYESGVVYRARGQRDLAMDQFEAVLRLQPAYGPAWLGKAQIYEELVNLPRAREAYEQALKSNDSAIREAAAVALRRMGVKI